MHLDAYKYTLHRNKKISLEKIVESLDIQIYPLRCQQQHDAVYIGDVHHGKTVSVYLRTRNLLAFLGPDDGSEIGGDVELGLESSLLG